MTLGNLMKHNTVQGDVVLTLWRDGEAVACDRIEGTEDLKHTPKMGLWSRMEVKYIFASADGLHFDFETED